MVLVTSQMVYMTPCLKELIGMPGKYVTIHWLVVLQYFGGSHSQGCHGFKVVHYTQLQSWTPPALHTHTPPPPIPMLISVDEFKGGREGRKRLFKGGNVFDARHYFGLCHLQIVLVNHVVLFFGRLPLLLCSISLL